MDKKKRPKLYLRPKSPILMSTNVKMELIKRNILSISNIDGLNTISKEIQDKKELLVDSPIIHPTKSLSHLNVCNNFQSTPNTHHLNKLQTDPRTIMNLSPIVSASPRKTNVNNCQDSFKKIDDISLSNFNHRQEYYEFDKLLKNVEPVKESTSECKTQNSSILPININEKAKRCLFENEKAEKQYYKFDKLLKNVEPIKESTSECNAQNSPILPINTNEKAKRCLFENEKAEKRYYKFDKLLKNVEPIKESTSECNAQNSPILPINTNEKAKRCLFENEKTDSVSNFNNDQDSLNISLDILEEVCQMSEIIDNSSPENIQIGNKADNKKNKLAVFLYGNDNSTKLDDTKEENELLELALSMEDNLLTEIKSNNKLSFKGEFTSLNQLKNNKTNLLKNDELKTYDCDSKHKFLDSEVINDIGNTQMCEIADITQMCEIGDMTEPLESFDDQWTQQYYTNNSKNVFSLTNVKDQNNDSLNVNKIVPNAVLKSPINVIKHKVNLKENYLLDNIENKLYTKSNQSALKNDRDNFSTTTYQNTNISSSLCKGFLTALGKSIKVSDDALQKAQSLLKDELDYSLTSTNNKNNTNINVCNGFSTAGGKSINVSDKTLLKAQSLLKDELNYSLTSTNDKTITNTNVCNGFSTASGKSIKVSDKTLLKAQSLLKDELDYSLTSINDKTITNTNVFNGFSTAGGKSIKVSDDALQKVRSILTDELDDLSTSVNDKTITNLNICKGFSTAGGKSIKVSDSAIKKVEYVLNDDFSGLQLFNNSSETIDITINSNNINEGLNSPKLDVNKNSKSKLLNILKNDEESALEDLSLIDTIEKFERDQIESKPTLSNKRPGSPTYEINHTFKRTVYDEKWENDALKTSFDVYLSKKVNGPKVLLPKAVDWITPKTQNLKVPKHGSNIDILKLNTDDAFNLKLFWNNKLSDLCKNKIYNFQDIKTIFLSHHFVNVKLVPKKWIENHFSLIVWKLAATQISFPNHFGNKLLTAENILHQLLFRYYREIEKCQRSALKKILEKDESATKRIILCVSKVIKTNIAEIFSIELTDGWYRIQGLIDYEMNVLLHKGIVKVGTKLMICNAELIGAREGIDPLDVHDGIKLKISTNSTRRVRWYTKLGFYKNASLPIPITLESVLPRGGIIGSLSLIILRKYPMMYFERRTNSKSILRNEKAEAIEAEKYEVSKQKSLEIISNKVETEMISEMASTNKKSKKCFLRIKKENVDELSIEELSNLIENSIDPIEIQSLLSQEKLDAINNFKKSEQERFYNELQKRVNKIFNDQFKNDRKVIPLFKLRVVDEKYASTGLKSAILSIWNPSEDVSTILNKSCEGQYCKFYHLTTNGFKNGELQISANKNTRFNFQGFKSEYAKREVQKSFKNIWLGTYLPLFGELDFVGIVISNINKNINFCNEIYISDKEMNIISILFQGDIKEYGCDDLMSPGSIIFATNIQFKGFNPKSSIPKLYNTEQSSFTTIPKAEHILKIFNDYKIFMKKSENQDFIKCCQNKLNDISNKNIEVTKICNKDSKYQCLNTSKNAFNRSYGELSTTIMKTSNTSQSEYSPAQKRIKMLNNYGRPPPLTIVHTKPPDKKLMSQFKTPTRL